MAKLEELIAYRMVVDRLRELRAERTRLEDKKEVLRQAIDLEWRERGVLEHVYSDGVRLQGRRAWRATLDQAPLHEAIEALRMHGLGEDAWKIHHKTLASWVTERGGMLDYPLEDFVTAWQHLELRLAPGGRA